MGIDCEQIIRQMRSSQSQYRGRHVNHIAVQLAAIILQQRDFASLNSFVDFCADPDNLRTWLPSHDDRLALSEEIARTLRPLRAA